MLITQKCWTYISFWSHIWILYRDLKIEEAATSRDLDTRSLSVGVEWHWHTNENYFGDNVRQNQVQYWEQLKLPKKDCFVLLNPFGTN